MYSRCYIYVFMFCMFFVAGCDKKQNDPVVDKLPIVQIRLGNEMFDIEVADNDNDRLQGLMYRKSLGRNEGMLFIFPAAKPLTFHMNNCYVDLDGVFISSSGRVLNVELMRYPRSGPSEYYHSVSSAQYVIELPAGTASRIDLRVGDKIEIPDRNQ